MCVKLTEIEKNILDDEIGAGNRTLYDFCSGDKALYNLTDSTEDIDILAAQMWLIGRSYAAQPERRYYGSKITLNGSGDGLDTFYDKMAENLISEQKDDFKMLQEKIKKLNEAPRYDEVFKGEEICINVFFLKVNLNTGIFQLAYSGKAVHSISCKTAD